MRGRYLARAWELYFAQRDDSTPSLEVYGDGRRVCMFVCEINVIFCPGGLDFPRPRRYALPAQKGSETSPGTEHPPSWCLVLRWNFVTLQNGPLFQEGPFRSIQKPPSLTCWGPTNGGGLITFTDFLACSTCHKKCLAMLPISIKRA